MEHHYITTFIYVCKPCARHVGLMCKRQTLVKGIGTGQRLRPRESLSRDPVAVALASRQLAPEHILLRTILHSIATLLFTVAMFKSNSFFYFSLIEKGPTDLKQALVRLWLSPFICEETWINRQYKNIRNFFHNYELL